MVKLPFQLHCQIVRRVNKVQTKDLALRNLTMEIDEGDGGDGGDGGEEPASCYMTNVTPCSSPRILSSQTMFKSCYAPGSSDTVFMSIKLEESTIDFIDPTLVFDIVKVNPDKTTTSVAGSLLGNQAITVTPDIFKSDITEEQLLNGLGVTVSFKFLERSEPGNYVMVISLFMDEDAFNPDNLVSRLFYRFEIKETP